MPTASPATVLDARTQAEFAVTMATCTLPAYTRACPDDTTLADALDTAVALLQDPESHPHHYAAKQAQDAVEAAMVRLRDARLQLYTHSETNPNMDAPFYLDSAARTAVMTVSCALRAARAAAGHNPGDLTKTVRATLNNTAKVAADQAAASSTCAPVPPSVAIAAAKAAQADHLAHLLELSGLAATPSAVELTAALLDHYSGDLPELVTMATTLATPQP